MLQLRRRRRHRADRLKRGFILVFQEIWKMVKNSRERTPNARIVLLGGREGIAEGLRRNFGADISHRCMTAPWPACLAGAVLVFGGFTAMFAILYWIGDQPISNVPGDRYIDYL